MNIFAKGFLALSETDLIENRLDNLHNKMGNPLRSLALKND